MDAVLNRITQTVHKRSTDTSSYETECGATIHLDPGHLKETSLERARAAHDASKCGRCFEDAGGY